MADQTQTFTPGEIRYGVDEVSAEQAAPAEGEPEPGTYWERAVMERVATGGAVDWAAVRGQMPALLAEVDRLTRDRDRLHLAWRNAVDGRARERYYANANRADLMERMAADAKVSFVHVVTPECIIPCGAGVRDVTVTALIGEATCVECLRTIAQATHGDALDEAPDIGLAERVAHLEASRADEAHGMATILRGIVDRALKRVADLEEALEEATGLMAAHQEDLAGLRRRVDAVELAARESAQSGGAPHAAVSGGGFAEDGDH